MPDDDMAAYMLNIAHVLRPGGLGTPYIATQLFVSGGLHQPVVVRNGLIALSSRMVPGSLTGEVQRRLMGCLLQVSRVQIVDTPCRW
jgi:hypothetical protein